MGKLEERKRKDEANEREGEEREREKLSISIGGGRKRHAEATRHIGPATFPFSGRKLSVAAYSP